MFLSFLVKKLKFWQIYSQMQQGSGQEEEIQHTDPLSKKLQKNLENLRQLLGQSNDVKIHEFHFGNKHEYSGALLYIDGMVNQQSITDSVLNPLLNFHQFEGHLLDSASDTFDYIQQRVLCFAQVQEAETISELLSGCLSGETLLLMDGVSKAARIDAKGWEKRSVEEPRTEAAIRGPREGFTENIRTNISLIRKIVRHEQLRVERMVIGRKTRTEISIMYLTGVADPHLIDSIKYRLKTLNVDSILDAGYIEQYIEDAPFSIFPTVGYSERPDNIARKILEGRAAIVVDGSPFVLSAPLLFIENFHTAEDYYYRPLFSSLLRLLRYIAFVITVFAPAIYIALTTFHQEFIPTSLLITMANAREGIPFPAAVESLIMVFAFELLREGGLRLPRPLGQAIGIVGALIMGEAAVGAGLVGEPLVITVAISAVAGFLVTSLYEAVSVLRLIMIVLSSVLGIYGIGLGVMGAMIHLASLKSFGITYFSGFNLSRDLQDSIIRMPLWFATKRPKDIAYGDATRRRFFIPPMRPYKDQEAANQKGDNGNEELE